MSHNKQLALLEDKSGLLAAIKLESTDTPSLCALHRQVWDLTGINIEIAGPLSETLEVQFYTCHLPSNLTIPPSGLTLPRWRTEKRFTHLSLYQPFELKRDNLSFQEELIPLREAYVKFVQENSTEQAQTNL